MTRSTPVSTFTLLSLRGLGKSFGGTQALHSLDLSLARGEALGLIGENGAGKSTLIKLLSGVHSPDTGQILWNGQPVEFRLPTAPLEAGIATIHQEIACFGQLTVAENLLMREDWPRYRWGGVNWPALHALAGERLQEFGMNIPSNRLFSQLSPAQKQEVAIVRALAHQAQLLILDEPTASLSEPEVKRLFQHLERLRKNRVAMIYVSHRLDEILHLTDRVAVLRDGALVATYPTRDATVERMVRDMVGRSVDQVYPHTRTKATATAALEVSEAGKKGLFENVTLSVRHGEIVGLGGLVGAGRSELARAIIGLYPLDSGTMRWLGQPWNPGSPADAVRAGLVYLPEERKRQGLVLDHSLRASVSIGFNDLLARFGLISPPREKERVAHAIRTYSVRAQTAAQPVGTLSGGNQQKAMLARWLERGPRGIILDEPTRGVDVGAKVEIHRLIDRLAGQGKAVLLISSDLPELIGMSDRILVMHEGHIQTELAGAEMTQENVLLAASGISSLRTTRS